MATSAVPMALSLALAFSPAARGLTVPSTCNAADPRSSLGCTAQINAALAAAGRTGGSVLLEAGESYLVVCPNFTGPLPQPMPDEASAYPTYGPSALSLTGGSRVTLASTSVGRPASIVVDFTPQPCAMLTVLNSSDVTVQDLTLDALRPAQTSARMESVAVDGRSFTAFVPPPTATANTSFAGAAAGSQAWLLNVETVQPVERVQTDAGLSTWQYAVPTPSNAAAYVWRDPQSRLPSTFDERSRTLNVTFDGSAQLAGMARVGQWVSLRHWVYGGDAVYAILSRDVTVQRVVLYSAAGMGFRADLCVGGRTAFRNVSVLLREGRSSSIAADAVHFMSCAGEVELSGSTFENHGDDGLNVHGQYEVVQALSADRRTVTFKPGWQTAVPFAAGTAFRFRHRLTLRRLQDSVLRSVSAGEGGALRATFADALAAAVAPDSGIFVSLAFSPATKIVDNTWRRCRCRGAVLSTGDAPLLVARNTFYNTTRSAILLLDGGVRSECYLEGPFTANATLVNNTAVVHPDGYFPGIEQPVTPGAKGLTLAQSKGAIQIGAGAGVASSGSLDLQTAELYLGNASLFGELLVASNTIVMAGPAQPGSRYFPTAAIHVGNTRSVALRDNKVRYDLRATARRESDFCTYNCSSVVTYGNSCQEGSCTLSREYCGL